MKIRSYYVESFDITPGVLTFLHSHSIGTTLEYYEEFYTDIEQQFVMWI